MKSFLSFIKEEKELGSLTIFDIDETLFKTSALISVMKDGKVIKRLSNQEYNTYKLKSGEDFDFSEFRDAEKFNKESVPIRKMLAKAKMILKNSESNPLSKVIILTARSNFDDKETFLNTFRKYGFNIDKVRVERAGNLSGSTAANKATIIRKYLDSKQFNKVRFFDDAESNLVAFHKLETDYPDIRFEGYLVKEDGSATLKWKD